MAASISIPLFSRPAWELNRPEQHVTSADLIRLRDSLHDRLTHAVDTDVADDPVPGWKFS